MSSRGVISALLLLAAYAVSAADWGTLAADSDRTLDSALLSALQGEDFDTKVLICIGVGKRADPFVGTIIRALMESDIGKTSSANELLLRMLLQELFDPSKGEKWITQRIEANRDELDSMAGQMAQWKDPQLAGIIVHILPTLDSPRALSALAQVGLRVVRVLEIGRGMIDTQEAALALDFLAAVEGTRRADFLEQCSTIARLSRERILVERAREVAREIAAEGSAG